jgi:hypothetical protein
MNLIEFHYTLKFILINKFLVNNLFCIQKLLFSLIIHKAYTIIGFIIALTFIQGCVKF